MKKRLLPITLAIILMMTFIPFSSTASASDEFTATLFGELDADVNTDVPEWGISDMPEASVPLLIGQPVTIFLEFSNPIKFTGNRTGISTNIPVLSDEDAESTGAFIMHFIVDGNDLGSKLVPLIDRDGNGFMTIDIARQWDGSYDEYDLAGMDPFTSLEITFIVPSMPEGEIEEELPPIALPTHGYAWFAGTVLYAGRTDGVEGGLVDWYQFQDQSTAFEIGVPFTLTLDLGSEIATHDNAHWDGFFMCIQTDVDANQAYYEAFIDRIVIDGREISFDAGNIEVDYDRGLRVPLTSTWSEAPLSDHSAIGSFSKIEVTLVIGVYGVLENPFRTVETPAEQPPMPPAAPIESPEPPTPEPEAGLPGWVIPSLVIGLVIIIGVLVIAVILHKKSGVER